MKKLSFNLWNDLDRFDLGDSNARPGVYLGQQAAYLENPALPSFFATKFLLPVFAFKRR
ncbi:hypothetical protein [Paenibacillus cisolokensis]|uniref:hypothetical protein n=1 Tax=Paenibacillus cisolokensis TaxID=1658519 RepID=UPI001BCEA6B9|nr:hypothetical protein [Paenibacillus cisolokensis]